MEESVLFPLPILLEIFKGKKPILQNTCTPYLNKKVNKNMQEKPINILINIKF